MTDELMVKRLRQHDEEAFEFCYNKYIKLVFHAIIQLVGSYEAAEELSQNTFVKMYNNMPKFDGQFFKAWLLKIAKNEALNYIRSIKDNVEYFDYLILDELAATTEMTELLRELEDILEPIEYEIVIMRNLYNMKNKDIAHYFDRAESTVSEIYAKALTKFKKIHRKGA